MNSSMEEDAVTWLHEALKIHTSRDGTYRDSDEICDSLKTKFESKYGGFWAVIMGNYATRYTYSKGKWISFMLDNSNRVLVFEESSKK
uniref:Dynein light chain n=1 Tax=Acrobeloides nanus TaxID=290746 RepID=A0A914D2V0_9BILA